MTAPHDSEDAILVRRFLEKWKGVSGPKVALQVPDIEQKDVSRWRTGDWTRLTEPKRDAIKKDLERTRDAEREEKLIAARWMRLKADELEREARPLQASPAAAEKRAARIRRAGKDRSKKPGEGEA